MSENCIFVDLYNSYLAILLIWICRVNQNKRFEFAEEVVELDRMLPRLKRSKLGVLKSSRDFKQRSITLSL